MNTGSTAGHGNIHTVIDDQRNMITVRNRTKPAGFFQIIPPAGILLAKLHHGNTTLARFLYGIKKRFFGMVSTVSYKI